MLILWYTSARVMRFYEMLIVFKLTAATDANGDLVYSKTAGLYGLTLSLLVSTLIFQESREAKSV
jgi:hypothetical protein